jgi:hypothetical protein
MTDQRLSRRHLLQSLLPLAAVCQLGAGAMAADASANAPLLSPDAKEAKAVKYVEDASTAQGALKGSTCANCAVYQGKNGSTAGPCQIFPGKAVKAAGWCTSWAPQM